MISKEKEKEKTTGINEQSPNLVLIGMPGAGKSTIGGILSRMTGRQAIETDDLVEERAGISIPQFFSRYGEEAFRRLESEIVSDVGRLSGKILITGGGVVTRPENYAPLRRNGLLIELLRPVELLETVGRPLSAGMDSLRIMEAKRRPMYDRFRHGSVSNTGTPEEAAKAVWTLFLSMCAKQRQQ